MRARLGGALLALCLCAGVLAGAAGAKEARLAKPHLGTFTETKGLAVEQGSHDVYAIDGRSEVQQIKVSATAGKAKLRFGAGEVEVAFNVSAEQMETALIGLICPGEECLFLNGGPGNAGASSPYVVGFQTALSSSDVEQIQCESGTPALTGGSGCTVETLVNGVNGTIARYHADGTPSDFSALGTNRIDGRAPGPDQTPQGALHFDVAKVVQLAVDESPTATDGEIYATQLGDHLVDIFAPSGAFKGQLTTYKEGLETKPLKNVCGVAVDPAGNVYVADFATGIHKYEPAGDPVVNADSVANFTTVALPCALGAGAGATAGFLFAGRVNAGLFKLDPGANGEVKYEVTNNATTVAVDPTSGQVLSATGSEVREFDASGPTEAKALGAIAAGSETRGVGVDGSSGKGGSLYVSRAGLTHLDVYGPLVEVPIVESKDAGPVGGTTATLNGTISADGGPNASCHFEYLSAATFAAQKKAAEEDVEPKSKEEIAEAAFAGAQSAPCEPPGPFSGAGVNAVSGEATSLSTETEYEFRLVGENANGQIAGSPLSFETFGKPVIEGGKASQVTATTALISGAVNPRGLESEVAVEYLSEEQFEESEFSGATVVPAPNVPPAATGSGDLSAATGNADLTAGSTLVFGLGVESGEFEAGQRIAGAGIPAGTTIVKLVGGGSLTLSQAAEASGANVPLSATSNRIKNLQTSAGRFGEGQAITGTGIPPGTTILAAQAGQLLLSKEVSEAALGAALSATGPQPVAVKLSGLAPNTPYVFRIVAQSSAGAGEPGEVGSFGTFPLLGAPLPEERGYEMVSPAAKIGDPYAPEPDQREGLGGSCFLCTPGWAKVRMPMQASPEGDAVTFEGDPFEGGLASGANEYRARRGAGGWETAGLSTPLFRDEVGEGFKAFSADLGKAVVVQRQRPLTPEAPGGFANLYLQEEGKEGLVTLIEAEPEERDENSFKVTYAGANAGSEAVPAFTHVIFEANDALSAEDPGIAPQAPAVGAGETNLYEWSGGALHLVNVLPGNGEAAPNAVFGSGLLLALAPGNENFNFDHAISEDGSRIFWSKVPGGQVYVREGGTSTIEIPDSGRFLTATPEGAKVLLDDGMLYDLKEETLSDLSGGAGGFEGLVGKSEDLARIYFVDSEALTAPSEENANGEAAKAGQPNLYLWEEGAVRFIATLLVTDNEAGVGKLGAWRASAGDRLAQASADGRFLAFESRAPITGYDSTIAAGEGCLGSAKLGIAQCFEVFEYDAQEETLICASCRASGERPIGPSNLALIGGSGGTFPQPQSLPGAGEGRLFFESQDPLSQRDTNGHIQDVYEWEPDGVGDCTRARGCLALISSGTSPKDSFLLDASDTGDDVFFITRDQLVAQDKDDFLDVYDARVNGGFGEESSAPCAGEACAGPVPPAPGFEAPSSSGVGPEAPLRPHCRRGYVRRGGKCVRKPHKHRRHRAPKPHRGGGRR